MEGRTTREIAIKIEAATKEMNQFIAVIGGKEHVINGVTWMPVTGGNGQCVAAEPISPQHAAYSMTRKATAEEQGLVDQIQWPAS